MEFVGVLREREGSALHPQTLKSLIKLLQMSFAKLCVILSQTNALAFV